MKSRFSLRAVEVWCLVVFWPFEHSEEIWTSVVDVVDVKTPVDITDGMGYLVPQITSRERIVLEVDAWW